MGVVCEFSKGAKDICDLASTFCTYDLRKGDLFVWSWGRVRRVRWGHISSELLMCSGGLCSILLLSLVVRCQETIVTVWGYVRILFGYRALLKKAFLGLGALKSVVCLCRGCDGCCVFCLNCVAWSCRCLCMGSMIVSSCRCCMFVSCVHPVAILNAAFCMTCSLLMLVEDARGDHMEYAYSRACLMTTL